MGSDELRAREEFADRYRVPRGPANDEVERAVLGSDLGANGYTTLAQADRLIELISAGPGSRLLDLGAGRGWPGLHIASAAGCEVVLTDPAVEGLAHALRRAERDGSSSVRLVASSGGWLPFGAGSFDAVVHTDVIC